MTIKEEILDICKKGEYTVDQIIEKIEERRNKSVIESGIFSTVSTLTFEGKLKCVKKIINKKTKKKNRVYTIGDGPTKEQKMFQEVETRVFGAGFGEEKEDIRLYVDEQTGEVYELDQEL